MTTRTRVCCTLATVLLLGGCGVSRRAGGEGRVEVRPPTDCAVHLAQAQAALAAGPSPEEQAAAHAAHAEAMHRYHACLGDAAH